MKTKLTMLLMTAVAFLSLTACAGRGYYYSGPPAPGAYWVPGHYGYGGNWIPGHYR
jgi:hypothetical protein